MGWSCQGSQSQGFLVAMYAYLGDMGEEKRSWVCLMNFEICPAYIEEEFTIGKAYTCIAVEAIPAWMQLTPCTCVTGGMLAEPCSCWCTTTKTSWSYAFPQAALAPRVSRGREPDTKPALQDTATRAWLMKQQSEGLRAEKPASPQSPATSPVGLPSRELQEVLSSPCMVSTKGRALPRQQAPGFSRPRLSPAVSNSPDP